MTLPTTGPISFSAINVELGRPPRATLSLSDPDIRILSAKPTGPLKLSDFHGKSFVQDHRLVNYPTTWGAIDGAFYDPVKDRIYVSTATNFLSLDRGADAWVNQGATGRNIPSAAKVIWRDPLNGDRIYIMTHRTINASFNPTALYRFDEVTKVLTQHSTQDLVALPTTATAIMTTGPYGPTIAYLGYHGGGGATTTEIGLLRIPNDPTQTVAVARVSNYDPTVISLRYSAAMCFLPPELSSTSSARYYVFGGRNRDNNPVIANTGVGITDLDTTAYPVSFPYSHPFQNGIAVPIGIDRIMVYGGLAGTTWSNAAFEFNAANDTFVNLPNLPAFVADAKTVRIDKWIYSIGTTRPAATGASGGNMMRYNTETGVWETS